MQPTNTLLAVLVLSLSFLTSACQLDPAPRADLVIVGGTMIQGTVIDGAVTGSNGGESIENAIVIIRDGRIVAAGPQSHVPFPKGVATLDARGKWIVPGPETTQIKEGQSADLLILESDPRIEGQTHPKIFLIIRAGKVIEPENLPGQTQP